MKSGLTSGKDDSEGSNSEESEEEDEESVSNTSGKVTRQASQHPTNNAYSGAALGLQSDDEEKKVIVTRSHTYMGAVKPVQAKV